VPAVDQHEQHSLKGNEMITGGSIIIPIDITVLATTTSITRNGCRSEADLERGLQFAEAEGGIST